MGVLGRFFGDVGVLRVLGDIGRCGLDLRLAFGDIGVLRPAEVTVSSPFLEAIYLGFKTDIDLTLFSNLDNYYEQVTVNY